MNVKLIVLSPFFFFCIFEALMLILLKIYGIFTKFLFYRNYCLVLQELLSK